MQLQPLPAMAPTLLQPQAALLAVSWVSRSQMGYQWTRAPSAFTVHVSVLEVLWRYHGSFRSGSSSIIKQYLSCT